MKRYALLCIIALYATASFAIPAQSGLHAVQQPDGNTLMVQLIGDEYFHYHATSDGLPIMQNESGAYVYANMQNDMFVATDMIAHDPSMRNAKELHIISQLQPVKIPETAKQLMQKNNERHVLRAGRTRSQSEKIIGKQRQLVILVDYPDAKMTYTKDEFDAMMNQKDYNVNGSVGSLSDYFYDQSYGQLEIDFDVVGPFTASKSIEYYGENYNTVYKDIHVAELITEAVNMAHEAGTDFSKYDWTGDGNVDQVFVIYAGYGEHSPYVPNYSIWPKKSTLEEQHNFYHNCDGPILLDGVTVNTFACASEFNGWRKDIIGIGVIAHEFSHCLGLPDFYDTNTEHEGAGMGVWSLMDAGHYNSNAYVPCAYTSYERMFCGWLEPVELTEDTRIENMRPITEAPEAYIIYNKANRNEYYLLENHQQSHNSDRYHAWDSKAYGHGMLVVHVDYDEQEWLSNSVNNIVDRQRMTIIPANNLFKYVYSMDWDKELTGDLYPGITGNTALSDISVPRAELSNPNSDGAYLMNAPITNITENDGGISFNFHNKMAYISDPVLEEPTDVDSTSFVAHWETINHALNYTLEITDLLPSPMYEPVSSTLFEFDLSKMEPFASATEDGTERIDDEIAGYFNMDDWYGIRTFLAPQGIKIGTTDSVGNLISSLFKAPYDGKLTVKFSVAENNTITGKLKVSCFDDETVSNLGYAEVEPDGKIHVLTIDSIDNVFFLIFANTVEPVNITYLSAQALTPPTSINVKTYESIEDTSFPITDLRAGGHYSYRIKANTIYGATEWSEPMEVWLSGPTTSITDIQNSLTQPRAIYNLQGQRLSKPQRGINIMDGKKIIYKK
ncbi:MAG: M6 family metalloprotease domain-containing protein [Paludibacteraceae bacterium]|nr:M6 family metalloprotease domain-containing protein [Paludibacteraceae bacterium]